MSLKLNPDEYDEIEKLVTLIKNLNLKGHNPATSGNYSLRLHSHKDYVLISESGVDKSIFNEKNLLPIHTETKELHHSLKNKNLKSSDETDIHLAIYHSTTAACVLHSHILESLLFANLFPEQSVITLRGLELLKGFKGITSHEAVINIPCFPNTQDIERLAPEVVTSLKGHQSVYGLILRGHGIYVWGANVTEAKRHLEVFEYLFKYHLLSKRT